MEDIICTQNFMETVPSIATYVPRLLALIKNKWKFLFLISFLIIPFKIVLRKKEFGICQNTLGNKFLKKVPKKVVKKFVIIISNHAHYSYQKKFI